MRAPGAVTLSPKRAEIGMATMDAEPETLRRHAGSRRAIASKRAWSKPDQVDLVDRQHDMADAHQGGDEGVAAGLRQHPLARIHQHHRQLGVGGAGRHVARVLLMPRRVGDDEAGASSVVKKR